MINNLKEKIINTKFKKNMMSSEYELDFLKEIANIGLGHAATGLSNMISERVDISLPQISIISLENIVGMKVEEVCVVKTGFSGEIKGALLIVLSNKTSFWLIDKMMGNNTNTTLEYNDMGKSAVKEFTNIIGGAFLTSISNFMDYRLMPKIPEMFTGKGFKIKTEFEKSIKHESEDVIYVKTQIFVDKKQIEAELYLLLDKTSFEAMFSRMNK